jgi:hypothetical protein
MPEFNLPNEDDPNFNKKVISLLTQLFAKVESQTQSFEPIATPTDPTSIGTKWFDSSDNKFKVMTKDGIKTLKYE